MRIWPLLIEYPWFEDWFEQPAVGPGVPAEQRGILHSNIYGNQKEMIFYSVINEISLNQKVLWSMMVAFVVFF